MTKLSGAVTISCTARTGIGGLLTDTGREENRECPSVSNDKLNDGARQDHDRWVIERNSDGHQFGLLLGQPAGVSKSKELRGDRKDGEFSSLAERVRDQSRS